MQDLNKFEEFDKEEYEKLKAAMPNFRPISHEGRMEICNVCPAKIEFLKAPYCSECGCLLALKTRVPFSSCPRDKW